MASFPIPLATLPPGQRVFGPAAIADGDTAARLVIDRTPPGGLNATPAAQLTIAVEQSGDGGATWKLIASAQVTGGLVTGRGGGVITASAVATTWDPGTGRQARAGITVAGAAVAVAGTLTTQ